MLTTMTTHKKNYVSLWLGNVKSDEELEKLLTIEYTEDGDWIAPPFAKAFEIDDFDEDFREAELVDESCSIEQLLSGFSYDDEIIAGYKAMVGSTRATPATAVILLYNFDFAGTPATADVDGTTWEFVGSVKHR